MQHNTGDTISSSVFFLLNTTTIKILTTMNKNEFKIFDSLGKLVRAGFPTYIDAMSYKFAFGNSLWYISR